MKRQRIKRKPFKPIDAEQFKQLRLLHCKTVPQVAQLLHVAPRTVMLWESGGSRIPYAAYKLLRVLVGYELPHERWEGWRLSGGALYSPVNRRFEPHELTYLSHYLTMARWWQADYEKRNPPVSKAAPTNAHLRLVYSRRQG